MKQLRIQIAILRLFKPLANLSKIKYLFILLLKYIKHQNFEKQFSLFFDLKILAHYNWYVLKQLPPNHPLNNWLTQY